MPFSFLVFVILVAGNALLIFGFCGIRYRQCFLLFGICDTRCRQYHSPFWLSGIRYRRGPSMVRNMRAVLKKASCGTRRIFRGIRCKKQASTVRKGYSVPKTASCGTRRIRDIRYQPPPLCGTKQDSLNRKRVSLALLRN